MWTYFFPPFVSVIVLKIKKCSRMVVLCFSVHCVQYYGGLFVDVNITRFPLEP